MCFSIDIIIYIDIFITGGTKSGKSEFAEYLGKKIKKLTYIALSEQRKEDVNWQIFHTVPPINIEHFWFHLWPFRYNSYYILEIVLFFSFSPMILTYLLITFYSVC